MTVWNSADKTAGMVLSNGDLTATETTATVQNVRADTGRTSGKYYFELTGVYTVNKALNMGVRRSTESIAASGITALSAGYSYDPTAGRVYCLAVDVTAGKLWIRENGGAWQGGGNPEIGYLPTDTLDSSGTWHPWLGSPAAYTEDIGVTANFGASAFAYTVPAGFVAWDGSNTLTVVSVSPDFGPVAGGATVTITGTGFIDGCTVTFDGASATSVTWVSATELTCVTPAGTVGFADVAVTNP